ncbi:unnamed protein product [Laminaria digitata]
MVMSLVGRPFLRKHNSGKVDKHFGPLGTDGKRLSQDVFSGKHGILKDVGRAFFRTENMSLNALRTVQDTLAAEHLVEEGYDYTAQCISELVRQQRTSVDVSPVS